MPWHPAFLAGGTGGGGARSRTQGSAKPVKSLSSPPPAPAGSELAGGRAASLIGSRSFALEQPG